MRSWLYALCATAFAGSALAQGAVDQPPVPRLDEKSMAYGYVFNEGGLGILGDTCFLLRVQPNETFSVAASVPNQQPTLEFVNGARCIFAQATAHLPRLTATASKKGGLALIEISQPGFYSVRITAEGADRNTRGMIIAALKAK
jgi:hypothetical protein